MDAYYQAQIRPTWPLWWLDPTTRLDENNNQPISRPFVVMLPDAATAPLAATNSTLLNAFYLSLQPSNSLCLVPEARRAASPFTLCRFKSRQNIERSAPGSPDECVAVPQHH